MIQKVIPSLPFTPPQVCGRDARPRRAAHAWQHTGGAAGQAVHRPGAGATDRSLLLQTTGLHWMATLLLLLLAPLDWLRLPA